MQFTSLALLFIICYSIYYYLKKKQNFFKDSGIPYVRGWPLFGNTGPVLFGTSHISEVMDKIYYKYPDASYVGAFDFVRPIIVLRDPELIKTVTIKNFDNFPDRKSYIDDSVDPLFGGNLFNMGGTRWREARNLLSPAFTSSKMKGNFELMVECVKNFVNYMSSRSSEANRMIATKDLFTKFTNDVIATCAFGISLDSLNNPKNDFYVLGREATNFEGILSAKVFMARSFPNFMKLFKIKIVEDHIKRFFTNIIGTTVQMRDKQGLRRPDMLQLMMDARGKGNKSLKLDITEMTAQAFIFFFGGFDTTSTQMCIMAHELAINPDIQKRLQDEIDEVMDMRGGKPTYEAITNMPYMDAVFNECLRRHTLVSFIDRLCTKAFEFPPAVPGGKPFTVQPGTNLYIPITSIHHDPKYYDNPNVFDPDRYYQKKVSINDVTNVGFGIGPRSCIGNRFAILETKILFFFLLSKMNLKANAKTSNPLTYKKRSFTISAEGGFWLSMEPRR